MTCPQCGATLEMDNTKEYMFCQFCGTKIANIAEKIDLNVSGKVEIDESGKIGNFIYVVDNALRAGNYTEAYNYCLRILETNPMYLAANLFKGLSAVMMSNSVNMRFGEGNVSVETAKSSGQLNSSNAADIIKFANYVVTMVPALFNSQCNFKSRNPFKNETEALNLYNFSYGIITYLTNVVGALEYKLVTEIPQLDQIKKNMISHAINMSNLSLTPLRYISGYHTQVQKNGAVTTIQEYKSCRNRYEADIKQRIVYFRNLYNSMPSIVTKINEYDVEIAKRNGIIQDYDQSLNSFLSTDPNLEKAYRHPGLFGRSKKIASVEEKFPQELLSKKAWSLTAKTELKQLQADKKKFMKENMI